MNKAVSQTEWIEAGRQLLIEEKKLTKHRDEVSRLRRQLPWVRVDKDYDFETTDGRKSLGELFGPKSQLIVCHFMHAPGDESVCPGCSLVCDHIDGARQHFVHRDIAFVAVSRAPLAEFLKHKKRMGWGFEWVSSAGTDFNYDFGVSYRPSDFEKGPVLHNFVEQKLSSEEQPGLTVFTKDGEGNVFRTYSTYERGLDLLVGAYNFVDLTPKGRDESSPMDWVRLHDEYGARR